MPKTIDLPAFPEIAEDEFKPLADCTAEELEAAAQLLRERGQPLLDEARALRELAARRR